MECAVHFRQSCSAVNAKGKRYTFSRLEMIAKIAASFPERERERSVSFSHYEDLMKAKVLHALVPFAIGICKARQLDHKGLRRVIDDLRSHTKVGPDGSLVVEAMPRWGSDRLQISGAPSENVQVGLF